MAESHHHKTIKRTHLKTTTTSCTNPFCFFCSINEPSPSLRRTRLYRCFKEMTSSSDQEQEHVLVLSVLFNLAANQPNDPEFLYLGIFECMSKLIQRGVDDKEWLLRDQNIYIPYYAAHIIGSYTMNRADFAEKAVESGVVLPLMELLRGKISWVEQRVAVRALCHLVSHERTFKAIADLYEQEIIELSKEIACNCFQVVYENFLGVKKKTLRVKYHCDLLTRGIGGFELENQKAEKWTSQLQCLSLYLLNCFVKQERSLGLICTEEFLKTVCEMWGGLENPNTVSGIGLIRTLCYTKIGRESVAKLKQVIKSLCNVSRSSFDWQYVAIDSLLLLLKDPDTRYKVIDIAALFLVDLVELEEIGEAITQTLLRDFHKIIYGKLKLMKSKKAERALKEIWDLKVERRKREKLMSEEEITERKSMVGELKQRGNQKFWCGSIEEAVKMYTIALDLCPLKMVKERIVLHSNRSQCYLLLKKTEEAAISDTTRALCLSGTVRVHSKSLWRRSQAYDVMGLAKESLMDCLTFIGSRSMKPKHTKRRVKIPYYAALMISKQMNATWPFNDAAKSKLCSRHQRKVEKSNGPDRFPGMSTIVEEQSIKKRWKNRNVDREMKKKCVTFTGGPTRIHR
ncbi:hypothetical protein Ddye_010635 [Dipteronia dyeriana]|uniref:ARM repeat N-terminal plant domain-containing protein n=1 Tax=Dipteronia dyeriana TaxID=168575 RepID=A0AAE0CP09_9ROSI|nr:hypothetical protein Ddye_010635 [Dipteronia dyeriana]